MSIKDHELLEKYNEVWEKVKSSIKKEFDCEPVYNEKYLKAKIKSYNGKISTNFHNNVETLKLGNKTALVFEMLFAFVLPD